LVLKAARVVSIGFSGPVIMGAIKGGAVVRLISAIVVTFCRSD